MTDSEIIELVNQSLINEFDVVVVLQQAFGVTLREEPRVREVRTLGDLHRLVIEKKRELEASQTGSDSAGRAG